MSRLSQNRQEFLIVRLQNSVFGFGCARPVMSVLFTELKVRQLLTTAQHFSSSFVKFGRISKCEAKFFRHPFQ